VTENAIVLFVKETGHILATLTRTGDPAAAPKPEELAGERFPVRDELGEVLVEIEAAELDSKVVPFEDDLLMKPQLCGVKDAAAALLSEGPPSGSSLLSSGFEVTLANPATQKTKVWVQVDSGSGQTREHAILRGEIDQGGSEVTIPRTFAPGSGYDVLVLAAGCEPFAMVDESV
jgi:hypothetical protein